MFAGNNEPFTTEPIDREVRERKKNVDYIGIGTRLKRRGFFFLFVVWFEVFVLLLNLLLR